MVEYNDEREVTRYVWDFHSGLMSAFEQRVGWAHLAAGKAAIGHHTVAKFILHTRGITGDPEAEAALVDGVEAFRQRVCRRVLAEHGAEVFVNRCPSCGRVVRTPKARQCFWCGFNWHTARVESDAKIGLPVKTAADIHGPWRDLEWDSGLVQRLKGFWSAPILDLPDTGLALFLRQGIAVEPVLAEARRRLAYGWPDESELYEGELARAVTDATKHTAAGSANFTAARTLDSA